jgi:hypothetical protein
MARSARGAEQPQAAKDTDKGSLDDLAAVRFLLQVGISIARRADGRRQPQKIYTDLR